MRRGRGGIHRLDRGGTIDVDHGIELLGQAGAEIVAVALRQRAIDHPDGALEPWLAEQIDRIPSSR